MVLRTRIKTSKSSVVTILLNMVNRCSKKTQIRTHNVVRKNPMIFYVFLTSPEYFNTNKYVSMAALVAKITVVTGKEGRLRNNQ